MGQHIHTEEHARRLSPSDLRTTLPDLRALAKRPLALRDAGGLLRAFMRSRGDFASSHENCRCQFGAMTTRIFANRFRLGDYHDVEHAPLAREHLRLGQHGESRFFRAAS